MDPSTEPLPVPGAWQGPETPEHWWCVSCGEWARCDNRDHCRRCAQVRPGRSRARKGRGARAPEPVAAAPAPPAGRRRAPTSQPQRAG